MWHDLRHAFRVFAKKPGFTLIAVISIAFGTGANVAIFSAADALLLRPMPVPRPSELYTVGSIVKRGIQTVNIASYPDYVDIRDRARSFDGLVAYTSRTTGFSAEPGAAAQVKMLTLVSGNFFRVLGVPPVIGRDFLPDEDRVPGRDAVVVLSYGIWKDQFGSDPAVLGHRVRIGGVDFDVVGVAPDGFSGIDPRFIRDAVYVPMAMWPRLVQGAAPDLLTARDFRAVNVKGRLTRGVTLREAQAELTAIGADLERAYPATNKQEALTLQTEVEVRIARNPLDSALVGVLAVLSMAVLGVACANVAGLLASRAPARAKEIALRLAIGAGRARLIRQLITESLTIAIAGGVVGLAVGYAGIILLRQIQFPTEVVAVPVMRLDARSMLMSLALALASTLLFGVGPAIQTTRVDLAGAMKSTDAGSNRRNRLAIRNVLAGLQVALSLVLLTIAVFAFQMFRSELVDGPGFRTAHIAKLTVDAGQAHYSDAQSVRFFERALEDARHVSGVKSSTLASAMPLFSMALIGVVPEGASLPDGQPAARVAANSVDESYFDTMGIPILAGRAFRVTDTATATRVAIVNDTMARHYWPTDDPVGKRFRTDDERGPWAEIVGVARTTQYWYPGEPPQDAVYFPFRQVPRGNMVLLAGTDGESTALLAPLRDVIRKLDADVPVYEVQTMERFYAARVTSIVTTIMRLVAGMGIMGMTLTMVGLYGLVSYAVSRRTREIGVRIAVGASYARVVLMILRQGMMPVWAGAILGLALSIETTRVLPGFALIKYHFNVGVFVLLLPALLAVTCLAAWVPARRAARVDPTTALRCE